MLHALALEEYYYRFYQNLSANSFTNSHLIQVLKDFCRLL